MTESSQPIIDYARPRPDGVCRLIDQVGERYAVVRLPEPPMKAQIRPMIRLLLAFAAFALAVVWIAIIRFDGKVTEAMTIVATAAALLAISVAAAVLGAGLLLTMALRRRRRRRETNAPEPVIRLCAPGSPAAGVPGTLVVTGVATRVEDSLLPLGWRACVEVTTKEGRPVFLLSGHPPNVLNDLVADLRATLFPGRQWHPKTVGDHA